MSTTSTITLAEIGKNTYGNGISAYDTWAYKYLTELLGSGVTMGGTDYSPLTNLAVAMAPVWQAVTLLLMLGVFGIGLAKTAAEKKFLGNWGGMSTPSQLGLCLLLLTPMGHGVTFGQTVFIKAVIYGSKAADLLWLSVYQEVQITQTTVDGEGTIKNLIATRFNTFVPNMVCAELIMAKGYAERGDYEGLLKTCGIPEEYYWFYADNPKNGKGIGSTKDASGAETKEPTRQMAESSMAKHSALTSDFSSIAQDPTSLFKYRRVMEESCYMRSFRELVDYRKTTTAPPPPPKPGETKKEEVWLKSIIFPADGGNGIKVDPKLNLLSQDVINQVTSCVFKNSVALKGLSEVNRSRIIPDIIGKSETPHDQAYRFGWAASASIGDLAGSYEHAYQSDLKTIALSASPRDSLPNRDSKALLDEMDVASSSIISKFTAPPKQKPIGNNMPGVGTQVADVGAMAFFGGFKTLFEGYNSKEAKLERETKWAKNLKKIREMARAFKIAEATMSTIKENKIKATVGKYALGAAGTVMKFVGIPAGAALSGVADVIGKLLDGDSPLWTFLIGMFLFIGSYEVIPQAFMAVATFLWLVRVVAWFIMIPMTTAVIAIPGTKVGHDAWKDLLAISLTPLAIIIFYLIGTFSLGVLVELSWNAMFASYCEVFSTASGQNGVTGGLMGTTSGSGECVNYRVLDWFGDLVSGTIIIRLTVFCLMLVAGATMMGAMMLKGPEVIFSVLGLRSTASQTSVLGGELTEVGQSIRGKMGMG